MKNFQDVLAARAIKMQLNPTYHEKLFRDRLELAGIDYLFQQVMGNYIVDFVIDKTIIEIDGGYHDEKEAYDDERTKYLMSIGYKVVRVKNADVSKFYLEPLKKKNKKIKKPTVNLKAIKSTDKEFAHLKWSQKRIIMQRERLHGE